jgi:tetraacyldisaccharide 4'-kinase
VGENGQSGFAAKSPEPLDLHWAQDNTPAARGVFLCRCAGVPPCGIVIFVRTIFVLYAQRCERMNSKRKIEELEAYLLEVIEERRTGKVETLLRGLLRVLSWIFRVIVQVRLWLYRHRIIRPSTLGCQVISVGNLTVGGTGKTPVVEVFARNLQQQGRKVAILSRGYKSKELPFLQKMTQRITTGKIETPPRVVSDGKRLLLDSHTAGDEPYMLASNLPDVSVVVDKDRVKAG